MENNNHYGEWIIELPRIKENKEFFKSIIDMDDEDDEEEPLFKQEEDVKIKESSN